MTQASTRDLSSIFDGFNGREATRSKIVRVARELRRLAARRKEFGVTAFDSRQIAIRHGYATGAELNHRALSWLAAVPKAARLYSSGRSRTDLNRNAHRVYVAREEWK